MTYSYEDGLSDKVSHNYKILNFLSKVKLLKFLIGNRFVCYVLRFVFGNKISPLFNDYSSIKRELKKINIIAPIRNFDHHYCHNCAAFYSSGFKKTHALSLDAFGDCFSSMIYYCSNENMKLKKTLPAYHSPAHY